MALVNGSDYDHIDLHSAAGGDVTRHMLKDAQARQDVSDLKSALPHYMALSYNQATMIPDNTNYDSLTTDGTYKCTTSAHAGTMTNAPASNAHTLYVINSALSGWVIQIAFINSVSGFLVRARIKNNSDVWYPSNAGTNKWITLQTDVNVTAQLAAFLDTTLAISGKAADAKATGDAIAALSTASLQNRGKIRDLGYTSIAQCNKMGFYEFVTADVANLTDLPTGWTTGGYVVTLKKAAEAIQYVFSIGKRYVRVGWTGAWYPDVFVDASLTISGLAADAKAAGDAIAALDTSIGTAAFQNRGKISSLGYTSVAQCNKMGFYEFTTADAANMTDLPAGWSTGGYVVTLKKASGAMQYIFNNRQRYVRDSFTGAWYPDATVDTTLTKAGFAADAKVVGDRFAAIARKCSAIYNESAYATSDKRLRIYMPKANGYLMIDMRHYNYNTNTGVADCWGINEAYAASESKGNRFQITNGGEWECAVRLTNGKDFSGGGTHGDEKNSTTLIFRDGKPCQFSDFTTEQEFDELKIIQTSELYSPTEGFNSDAAGNPTPSYKIADHGTEWVFSKDGICVTQYIKWAGANDLANTFMAMFPGRKKTTLDAGGTNIFDSIFTDVDYAVYSPTTGTSKVWAKAKKADIYSDVSKVHVVIDPVIYPDTLPGGNKVSETDNGASNNYYKLYWPVTSNADYTSVAYTTTDGELWKSQVWFKFEIN